MDINISELGYPIMSVITMLAISLLATRELKYMRDKVRFQIAAQDWAKRDLNATFDLVEKIAKDPSAPEEIKLTLRKLTESIVDKNVGKEVAKSFLGSLQRKRKLTIDYNITLQALENLETDNNKMAEDFKSALKNGISALLLMHADKPAGEIAVRGAIVNSGRLIPEIANAFDQVDLASI